jgi:heme/copper-type cytochrome/quinol oxidase subunit 1
MKRWLLAALLVAGVVCAGAGVALNGGPFRPASFGWTAYAPLSHATYQRVDFTWLVWAPRVGLALVAVGAGAAGAALSALVLLRPSRKVPHPTA